MAIRRRALRLASGVPAPGVGAGWKPGIRTGFLHELSDYSADLDAAVRKSDSVEL
jgi:hypothetical protein